MKSLILALSVGVLLLAGCNNKVDEVSNFSAGTFIGMTTQAPDYAKLDTLIVTYTTQPNILTFSFPNDVLSVSSGTKYTTAQGGYITPLNTSGNTRSGWKFSSGQAYFTSDSLGMFITDNHIDPATHVTVSTSIEFHGKRVYN